MKKRKITSVFLALGLFASLLFKVPISAEEADQSAAVEASGTISTNSISGWPQASDISSEAAVVMENTTNTILYSKNADEVLFPGSRGYASVSSSFWSGCDCDKRVCA